MIGKCEMCHERKRINRKLKVCMDCRRNFQETTDKYFDGDPFQPLRVAIAEMERRSGQRQAKGHR